MRCIALFVGCLSFALALPPPLVDAAPSPRRKRGRIVPLEEILVRLRETERVVVAAERAAADRPRASEAELARRLVAAQVRLRERDLENAAFMLWDLVEHHFDTEAGAQAVYFMGEALMLLDMPRFAAETLARNLGDERPAARRFHQRSIARLFELAAPARQAGYAELAGVSATPEARARLESMGDRTESSQPRGVLVEADEDRLLKWAAAYPAAMRSPELTYAIGRYLFLREDFEGARSLLHVERKAKPSPAWGVRSAYIAAAAALGLREYDTAIAEFEHITAVRSVREDDAPIVELAWMALGRIHHDLGAWQASVRAYRHVGRDSQLFAAALYETAWTLLRWGRFDRAVHVLDLLLVHRPQSPLVLEVKQLRAKIRIRQRDYPAAEREFLALREEFAGVADSLRGHTDGRIDVVAHVAATVRENLRHFSVEAVMPAGAVDVATELRRVAQASELAVAVGEVEHMLFETRTLLAQMEEALRSKTRARLFADLGPHFMALEVAGSDLVEVEEDLLARLTRGRRDDEVERLEAHRQRLRERVDAPLGVDGLDRDAITERLQALSQRVHELELTLAAQRAALIAAERYYEDTREDQRIDASAFLKEAGQLRDEIADLDGEATLLRSHIERARNSLRYNDPWLDARHAALLEYHVFLQGMWARLGGMADVDTRRLWERAERLHTSVVAARAAVDDNAAARLRDAVVVVVEERAKLDAYLTELTSTRTRAVDLVAQVLSTGFHDVLAEVENLVLRSEVGLLDVAWSMMETETEAIRGLERQRDRDLRELDGALRMGLEDVAP